MVGEFKTHLEVPSSNLRHYVLFSNRLKGNHGCYLILVKVEKRHTFASIMSVIMSTVDHLCLFVC